MCPQEEFVENDFADVDNLDYIFGKEGNSCSPDYSVLSSKARKGSAFSRRL